VSTCCQKNENNSASCLEHYIQFSSSISEKVVWNFKHVQRIAIYVHGSLYVSTRERKVLFKVRKVLAEEQMDGNCL